MKQLGRFGGSHIQIFAPVSRETLGSMREACLLTPIPSEPSEDPDTVAVPAVPGLAAAAAALLAVPDADKQPRAIRDTLGLSGTLLDWTRTGAPACTPTQRATLRGTGMLSSMAAARR
jgi:hypothetical protein